MLSENALRGLTCFRCTPSFKCLKSWLADSRHSTFLCACSLAAALIISASAIVICDNPEAFRNVCQQNDLDNIIVLSAFYQLNRMFFTRKAFCYWFLPRVTFMHILIFDYSSSRGTTKYILSSLFRVIYLLESRMSGRKNYSPASIKLDYSHNFTLIPKAGTSWALSSIQKQINNCSYKSPTQVWIYFCKF